MTAAASNLIKVRDHSRPAAVDEGQGTTLSVQSSKFKVQSSTFKVQSPELKVNHGEASPKRALWSNASEARNASHQSQIQSSNSKLGNSL
jgi:hypothetical protein